MKKVILDPHHPGKECQIDLNKIRPKIEWFKIDNPDILNELED